MNYAPIAAEIAVRLTREQVNSARPDAPVIPEAEPRPRRRARARVAAALRWAAHVLDPTDRPVPVGLAQS